LVFVCDIRLGRDNFESGVMQDMELQKDWVRILEPCMSLLKFRMSYNMKHGDKLMYLRGTLWYGIWAKEMSGESRLFVKKTDIPHKKKYDFKDYEETMFYHNKYTRAEEMDVPARFRKYVEDGKYKKKFDDLAELEVLDKYGKVRDVSLDTTIAWIGSVKTN